MRKLLSILVLVALVVSALTAALPASAGDVTESCTDITFDEQVFVSWIQIHEHWEVDRTEIFVWGWKIVDHSVVVNYYIEVNGGTAYYTYTVPLQDDCTPDWDNSHSGWNCDTTVNVESNSYFFAGSYGSGYSSVTFDQWLYYYYGIVAVHLTKTEYDLYHSFYWAWLDTQLTTATTSCTVYIGPAAQEMLLWTFNGGNLSEFQGAPVDYYMVDGYGTEHLMYSGVVGEYGDISIIVPPGDYPSDAMYGEYHVNDGLGNESVIVPSRMFVAKVYGFVVETVIQGPSNSLEDPTTYVVLGATDTVNLALRTSTPNAYAWK